MDKQYTYTYIYTIDDDNIYLIIYLVITYFFISFTTLIGGGFSLFRSYSHSLSKQYHNNKQSVNITEFFIIKIALYHTNTPGILQPFYPYYLVPVLP